MITKTRKKVGSGQEVYNAAVSAVKSWAHLQLGAHMNSGHMPVCCSGVMAAPMRACVWQRSLLG